MGTESSYSILSSGVCLVLNSSDTSTHLNGRFEPADASILVALHELEGVSPRPLWPADTRG
jgi:hypothetical protein